MKNITRFVFIFIFMIIVLAGCKNIISPSGTVDAYLKSIAAKDANQVASLSCPDYIQKSQDSIDSFMSVDLTLNDLSCSEVENDGKNALVNCSGTFSTSYNGEITEIDLSILSYQLQMIDGDWLVCGQQ